MKYFLTTAALALVLSSSGTVAPAKAGDGLGIGLGILGGVIAGGIIQQQQGLLITCAQNVVVHDKNLRTWFFLTILQTPGSTAIKNMQPRYS